jgi:hypothetical protein
MSKDEKRFEFEDKQYVIKPLNAKVSSEAQKVYLKAFKDAIEDGAILKNTLDDHMRRQGLWDDSKQQEYEKLIKKSAELEYKIKSGEYKKASQLREKALELKKIRRDLADLMMVRNSMDSMTADGLADNERFFYLITACVYDYESQKPVYSSVEDYMEKADTKLGSKVASEYASYAYSLEDDYESKFLENRVLKKLQLLDEKGNLVNREGKRVDEEGNLLDTTGSRIDINGVRIDINNNPVLDDDLVDELEFEDDLLEEPVEDTKPAKKSRASSAKRASQKKKVAANSEEAVE